MQSAKPTRTAREVPLASGEIVKLTVNGMSDNGEGVARYHGFAVFVPDALRGETITAEVTQVRNNYARARLLDIKTASMQRCNARCAVYDRCGGCSMQKLKYGSQLREKKQQVVDALVRIGRIPHPVVRNVYSMTEPWHYRNKMHYQLQAAADGSIQMGFYQESSHEFVPGPHCLLAQKEINEMADKLQELLSGYKVRLYDWEKRSGYLRNVMIRRAETGELMLVLITGQQSWNREKELAERLTEQVPQLKSVLRNFNNEGPQVILGQHSRLLAGRSYINDEFAGNKIKIAAETFYQVNPQQMKVLYEQAIDLADLNDQSVVVDAYCGIGTISMLAARKAKQVYGIEIVSRSVGSARENAAINKINNASFIAGKAEVELAKLTAKIGRPDVLIVDPPRHGCDKRLLQTVIDQQIPRVVYVSCNPSTMARDVAILNRGGYQFIEAIPVDMFGQTSHVETVCLLTHS